MRILVVEDEDSIASFVVKGLTAEGHIVERAAIRILSAPGRGKEVPLLDPGRKNVRRAEARNVGRR